MKIMDRIKKIKNYIATIVLTAIVSSGTTAVALNSGNEVSNNENNTQVSENLNKNFKENLKFVEQDINNAFNKINSNLEIQKKVEEEVNALKTKEEVLDQIKEIYAEEYNKLNEEKINPDNIVFNKTRNFGIKRREAKNGDKVFIQTNNNSEREIYNGYYLNGLVTVSNDKKIIERFTGDLSKYYPVNVEYEEVDKFKKVSIGSEIAKLVDTGIDYSELIEEKNKLEKKGTIKERETIEKEEVIEKRYKDALRDYYKNKEKNTPVEENEKD